jgi:hypothetical protein
MRVIIRNIWLIVAASIFWVVIVPALAAYFDGVFFNEDVRNKLGKSLDPFISNFEEDHRRYQREKENLDGQIAAIMNGGSSSTNLAEILTIREQLVTKLENHHPPVTVSGFYGNATTYIWLITYIALGILVFIINPSFSLRGATSKILLLAILGHISFEWTNWIRNFILYRNGRTVFSYVNYDVSPMSFFLQEFRVFGMMVMLAIVWKSWLKYYDKMTLVIATWKNKATLSEDFGEQAIYVSDTFNKWQVASIALAGTFLPWTWFFWSSVTRLGDIRYVLQAIIVHLIWGGTWLVISTPLLTVLDGWARYKYKVLSIARKQSNSDAQLILQINPFGQLQFVGTSIIALISFISPLLEVFR